MCHKCIHNCQQLSYISYYLFKNVYILSILIIMYYKCILFNYLITKKKVKKLLTLIRIGIKIKSIYFKI